MKRYGVLALLFLFMSLAAAYMAGAGSVVRSKHDLSRPELYGGTGPGPIQASNIGTTQVCVFCHTPHGSTSDAPLWNRSINTWDTYDRYYSDVMQALTYPQPEDPKTTAVHVKTRICLSCHDGTIALGNMVNLPYPFGSDVTMQGGVNYMPKTAVGYIGLDLRDDHPVAIQYKSGFASGQDPELAATVGGTRVWLYNTNLSKTNDGTIGAYVECTSCHNAHDNQYGNFLVDANDGSKICLNCHTKSKGAIINNAHDLATSVTYSPPTGGTTPPTVIGNYVSEVKCMTCHFPHKAGITDVLPLSQANPSAAPGTYGTYLLSFQEDKSCFNNPNRWNNTVNVCHGSNGRGISNKDIDIQSQVNKGGANSAHSALRNGSFNSYSGKHAATEQGNGVPVSLPKITNTHIVCSDCHNAHTAGKASPPHTPGTNTITEQSPLYGAGGVKLVGAIGPWQPPLNTNFDAFEPVGVTTTQTWPLPHYEYEICLKCHSAFAWGGGSPPTISDLSGLTNMTDQAKEFNTANAAYHTVIGTRNAGSYAPPAGSWNNGWGADSLMNCSDCHGNNISTGEPQGPHGSTNAGILVRAFTDSYDGTKVLPQPTGELCAKCHNDNVYNATGGDTTTGTGFWTTGGVNLHNRHKTVAGNLVSQFSYRCVNCHVRIPHGYSRRGMVVTNNLVTDPNVSIYARGGAAKITSFTDPGIQSYGTTTAAGNCSTVVGCHN